MSRRPDIHRQPLTAERIVATALELIDAEGLDQLSIRRLGDALAVQGMAVYRHVRGKDEILDGVRRLLVEEFGDRLAAAGPFADWRTHLRAFGTCYRDVGRAHPDAFGLLATNAVTAWSHGRDVAAAALTALLDAGFDEDTAIGAERTVIRYAIGFTLIEAANADDPSAPAPPPDDVARTHPSIGRLVQTLSPADGSEDLFHLGLDLILDGLAFRLSHPRPGAATAEGR